MGLEFENLVDKVRQQQQPHQLLMLFADAQAEKTDTQGMTGSIKPVMCVDKSPNELSSFSALVAEADAVNKDWNLILFAALSGSNGTPPNATDVDPYLNKMTNDVASGADLSRYVIFDRKQNPIEISL